MFFRSIFFINISHICPISFIKNWKNFKYVENNIILSPSVSMFQSFLVYVSVLIVYVPYVPARFIIFIYLFILRILSLVIPNTYIKFVVILFIPSYYNIHLVKENWLLIVIKISVLNLFHDFLSCNIFFIKNILRTSKFCNTFSIKNIKKRKLKNILT